MYSRIFVQSIPTATTIKIIRTKATERTVCVWCIYVKLGIRAVYVVNDWGDVQQEKKTQKILPIKRRKKTKEKQKIPERSLNVLQLNRASTTLSHKLHSLLVLLSTLQPNPIKSHENRAKKKKCSFSDCLISLKFKFCISRWLIKKWNQIDRIRFNPIKIEWINQRKRG